MPLKEGTVYATTPKAKARLASGQAPISKIKKGCNCTAPKVEQKSGSEALEQEQDEKLFMT